MPAKQRTVLVTGAAGSIGSAISRTLVNIGDKVILLDQDETGIFDLEEDLKGKAVGVVANIRDARAMNRVFAEFKPSLVFHAAALKHVVMCERYPEEATQTNVEGLLNVLNAARTNGVRKFIFISTDKAVNPTTIMGKTKKYGEDVVRMRSRPGFAGISVRFGNVMPSRGSVVPIFKRQIEEGRDLTVTHPKMTRYFMGIYDAVHLVIKASELGSGGETFVLDMGKEIYIKDLAELMIKISGKPLKVVYTSPLAGEKFSEQLMTNLERRAATHKNGLYIIKNLCKSKK
jgi:dTDP-glucose 4,6-dehydratase